MKNLYLELSPWMSKEANKGKNVNLEGNDEWIYGTTGWLRIHLHIVLEMDRHFKIYHYDIERKIKLWKYATSQYNKPRASGGRLHYNGT